MAAGEDLYHLDRGAFAELDPTLVVTQDLCAVCAVDVSEVDDALRWLGCRAEVVTLDPATLGGRAGDGRARRRERPARQTGPRRSSSAAGPSWTPSPTGRRRARQAADARAGVDRPGVHCRALGPRSRDRGRRRARAGTPGREVRRRGVGRDHGVRRRGRRRGPVRLPAGRGERSWRPAWSPTGGPAAAEVWAVDADGLIVRPGTRVVDGVAVLSTILHPDRCGPPDSDAARRIA